jgi:zinc D-Ala-D-Ala carboxypeptidase
VASVGAAAVTLTGMVVTAAPASAATGCVTQDFSEADVNTYEPCVVDEQVLLNDLYNIGFAGPNQLLTVDGYYGPKTFSDVLSFQVVRNLERDGITGPQTWTALCTYDQIEGFTGLYWQGAGCPSVVET